jgi:hypothetical protein
MQVAQAAMRSTENRFMMLPSQNVCMKLRRWGSGKGVAT